LTIEAVPMMAMPRALEMARLRHSGWLVMSRLRRRAVWQAGPRRVLMLLDSG
jgi:hypothetical protein